MLVERLKNGQRICRNEKMNYESPRVGDFLVREFSFHVYRLSSIFLSLIVTSYQLCCSPFQHQIVYRKKISFDEVASRKFL